MNKNKLIVTVYLDATDHELLFGEQNEKLWYLLNRKEQKELADKEIIILPFNFTNPNDAVGCSLELQQLASQLEKVKDGTQTVVLAVYRDDLDEVLNFLKDQRKIISEYKIFKKFRSTTLSNQYLCLIPFVHLEDRPTTLVPVITFTDFLNKVKEPSYGQEIAGKEETEPVSPSGKVKSTEFITYLS